MIDFNLEGKDLVLRYDSERGNEWVYEKLNKNDSVNIKLTFHMGMENLYGSSAQPSADPMEPVQFKVGHLDGEYISFDRDVLGIDFNLWIHRDIRLTSRSFVAERNVSIFRRINDLGLDSLRIGGDAPDAMPASEFARLLKLFPNSTELRKYVLARASSVLRQYVDTQVDGEEALNRYLDAKLSVGPTATLDRFRSGEAYKYQQLLAKLESMLSQENAYSERQWQAEILQIILLIFPKYIKAFEEVPVRDSYAQKTRSLDFMLVDSSGHVDIVEIKKPFDQCIVSKGRYRDNHIPLRELSGTVMQIEKYIFHLNKWGRAGEKKLTEKYQAHLPQGFQIKITNPGGIIILGREEGLTAEQKDDFEVIKRKYKNVVDIISYDDLVRRLRFTIEQLGLEQAVRGQN